MLSLLQHQQIQNQTPQNQKVIPKQFQQHIEKMRQQQIPGAIAQQSKKIRKPKEQWSQNFKLMEIGVPQLLNNEKYKKRYQIRIKFQDDKGKQRYKTIYFGKKDKIEYTDDHQQITRQKNQNNSKKDKTFFDANFWRMNLLNDTDDIKQNYINCVNKYI